MISSSAQVQIAFSQELLTAYNTTERSPPEESQEEDLVGNIAIEPENTLQIEQEENIKNDETMWAERGKIEGLFC